MDNNQFNNSSSKNPAKLIPCFSPDHTAAIYTVLCILLKMKRELGLEAMLEYQNKFLEIIEQSNPKFKAAVEQALSLMSVKKMYRDAMGERRD
ncbi:MAG: hypothetical protein Q8Q08_11895 [Candidatus Omnitrophota bacterium]|nr:hypothetical protein [Candidatus Omnitrophota bacterium]